MKKAIFKSLPSLFTFALLISNSVFAIGPGEHCLKLQTDLLNHFQFPSEVSAISPFSIDLALSEKNQTHKQAWGSQRAHREAITEILRERLENINSKSARAYWTLVDPQSYKHPHWSSHPRNEIETFLKGRWVALVEQNFRIKDPRLESQDILSQNILTSEITQTRGLAGRITRIEFVEGPTLNSPLENILLTVQTRAISTTVSLRDISELHFLIFKPRQNVFTFALDPITQSILKEIDPNTYPMKISSFSPVTQQSAKKEIRDTWNYLTKNLFTAEAGWTKIEPAQNKLNLGQTVTQFEWPKQNSESLIGHTVAGIQTILKAEQLIHAQYNSDHFKKLGARLGATLEGRKTLALKRKFGSDEYIHEIFLGKVKAAVDSEDGQSLLLIDGPYGEQLISVPGPQALWYNVNRL